MTTETKPAENLAAALAKAQGEMAPAEKDRENPHFKQRYATLAAVWAVIRVPFARNGLAVIQRTVEPRLEKCLAVETLLRHAPSGEEISTTVDVPVAQWSAQGLGSAITYGRRYGLSMLAGVVADEDDDGEAAVGRGQPASTPPPARQRSGTEAARARVAAANPPAAKVAAPDEGTVGFGPRASAKVGDLGTAELAGILDAGAARLAAEPSAPWAPKMRARLAALEAELAARNHAAPAEPPPPGDADAPF